MVDFYYLIRFADSEVAAWKLTDLVGEEYMALKEALLPTKKPLQVDTIIDSMDSLAKILAQKDGPIDLRVSENIKRELKSAGIEFTVLGKLSKP